MKIAVVGATGLVGGVMIQVLEEMFPGIDRLIPAASERSLGKKVLFDGNEIPVVSVQEAVEEKPEIALFSAGAVTSRQWAPEFAKAGTTVIDNSSAWRMEEHVPLIVPEINAGILTRDHKIIANPNCSTIQLVMALAPLHTRFGIRRIVVSTYQSVTGTGMKALNQMMNERNGITGEMAYKHPIDLNLFPHGGDFMPDGYTSEEVKLVNETRKILNDPLIRVTATVVRVPVKGGHSEAVNIEFTKPFEIEEVRDILGKTEGIIVQDDPAAFLYPMPLYAEGKNDVFVGRIRRDTTQPSTLNMWIVSDNLRKGAATNAVQIAGYLIRHQLV